MPEPTADRAVADLRAAGGYEYPSMPAEDALRGLLTRARQLLKRGEDPPLIAEDRLQRASGDDLDAVAPPPACGPLQRELDAALGDWAGDRPAPGAARVQLLILPPGDGGGLAGDEGVLAAWAGRRGLARLAPPDRAAVAAGRGAECTDLSALDEPAGAGPLVVPRLERWFLRRHDGLGAVRDLLDGIDRSGRRCLVGCNSWAWAFLCKAVDANLTLPQGRTFAAFDAARLRAWFRELAARGEVDPATFRLSATGRTLFADDGAAADDYYRTLAAHSLGVPWVAWHQWRRSLRSEKEAAEDAEHAAQNGDAVNVDSGDGRIPDADPPPPERRTLWVAALEEFTLPARHQPGALLILQALLIHGPLTEDELRGVIPAVRGAGLVSALISAGFVRRRGETLTIAPAAYPAIRAGLSAAGFPVDKL